MDKLALKPRLAWPNDAAEVARVYIESWHDTYPGMLPKALLCSMTAKGQTARWSAAIRAHGREAVLVGEHERHGIVGMASLGASRDRALDFDRSAHVRETLTQKCFEPRRVCFPAEIRRNADPRKRRPGHYAPLRPKPKRYCATRRIWISSEPSGMR